MTFRPNYVKGPRTRGNYPPDLHAYIREQAKVGMDWHEMVKHIRQEWPSYSHLTVRTVRNVVWRNNGGESVSPFSKAKDKGSPPLAQARPPAKINLGGPTWSHPQPKKEDV